jgi:hypothetical protein
MPCKKNNGMKRIVFVFIAFLATQSLFAQIRKIPAEVTESFKQKYAAASNVSWKDRLSSFVAEFELEGKKHAAYFDDDGAWKQTDVLIGESDLPAAVNDGFQKSKYTDWTIDRVERIDSPEGQARYRVQVKKGDIRKKNLLFNSEGRMIKDKLTI